MQIAFHLGVHCTDDERLLRCLQANAAMLRTDGIVVPDPDVYRTLMRDAAETLQGRPASEETETMMLEHILDDASARRMVVSWDSFLAYAMKAVRGRLYPTAGERARALRQTFPSHDVEFFMAIRNPATFAADLRNRKRNRNPDEIMSDTSPYDMRWIEVVQDIAAAVPDAPLTVWCDEDTPILWPEILAQAAGVPDGTALQGWDDLLTHVMEEEGTRRLHATLAEPPLADDERRRSIIANLLGEFVRPETVETEFSMPGWSQDVVDHITEQYDADVAAIAAVPGVRLLMP